MNIFMLGCEPKAHESFVSKPQIYVLLGDHKVADIVITKHAKLRWNDRSLHDQEDEDCPKMIASWTDTYFDC